MLSRHLKMKETALARFARLLRQRPPIYRNVVQQIRQSLIAQAMRILDMDGGLESESSDHYHQTTDSYGSMNSTSQYDTDESSYSE